MNGQKRTRVFRGRVRMQMGVLLLLFPLLTTLLTGWLVYDRMSEQVVRDTWQQQESLLRNACAAVNREVEQIQSFTWQLNNDSEVQSYLHLTEQTPRDILRKKGIIEQLQQMKAFSNTIADLGLYAEGLDIIITGESSYRAEDYYQRITGVTGAGMTRARSVPGTVALCRFAGKCVIRRILTAEDALAFVSSLPLNAQAGGSYAFFHLNTGRLLACLPENESGEMMLTDGDGAPVHGLQNEAYADITRLYAEHPQNRIRTEGGEYGILRAETDAEGLYCMAVIPYSELLGPSLRLRNTVMLIMGSCMILCVLAASLASRRLYAPLEQLIGTVRQLFNDTLPEGRNNEYQVLDEAIRLITAENHELALSNREVSRLLKNRVLNDWIEGRLKSGAEETLTRAGITLPYDRIQIAVAECAPRDLERLEARAGGVSTADLVEELAVAEDRGPMKVLCARRADGRVLILFNLDARHPAPESIYPFLQDCLSRVFRDCPCAMGVGRAFEKNRTADALVDAMRALMVGEEKNRQIALAEEIPENRDTEYSLNAEQQLMNRILSGKGEEAAALVRALCAPEDGAAVPRTDLIQALLFTLGRAARRASMEDRLETILRDAGFRADRMPAAPDAADRLCRAAAALAECMNEDVSSQEEKHYARLTAYLRREYAQDISLDSVGEALGMSPSYIGLVFRKVGDTSFLKYLTDIRIEETKRLLRETDLTLREIGQRVGMENQNTLIRTFKKAEGITPGQYRLANQTIDSRNG
ncbi:MAG: helix-turn-helix transcriptional regulator [Clostridia bacterium]|nr:helix-turn-helix transcriptional regulator [Clostridia bacterium]